MKYAKKNIFFKEYFPLYGLPGLPIHQLCMIKAKNSTKTPEIILKTCCYSSREEIKFAAHQKDLFMRRTRRGLVVCKIYLKLEGKCIVIYDSLQYNSYFFIICRVFKSLPNQVFRFNIDRQTIDRTVILRVYRLSQYMPAAFGHRNEQTGVAWRTGVTQLRHSCNPNFIELEECSRDLLLWLRQDCICRLLYFNFT